MKNSNKIFIGLLALLTISIIAVDFSLKSSYFKINLNDVFKNYEKVPIKSFKYIKLKGGNGYAINIKQTDSLGMRVMSSRKSFLKLSYDHDTLFVLFTVAENQNRKPDNLPIGLIVNAPAINEINIEGTNTLIQNWHGTNLKLEQTRNASVNISGLNAGKFTATGKQNSILNFVSANRVDSLDLDLSNNACVYLINLAYTTFDPVLHNDAQLIFSAASAEKLRK